MRIAVFNQKGGVGKTTTALNLAAGIARNHAAVRLIDLDPQAHLTAIHNDMPPDSGASVFSFYQDARPLAALQTDWEGIGRFIPAHADLIKVDSVFGKGPAILNRLAQGLDELDRAQPPRTTLIDCCPFLGVLSLNAVFAADRLLVPVSSDFLSLRGAGQLERTLKALEPVLRRRIERRYVLTRFDRRRNMSFEIRERMAERFAAELCETVISENVAVAEAPACGRDIFVHAPSSRGALDYAALTEELAAAGFF